MAPRSVAWPPRSWVSLLQAQLAAEKRGGDDPADDVLVGGHLNQRAGSRKLGGLLVHGPINEPGCRKAVQRDGCVLQAHQHARIARVLTHGKHGRMDHVERLLLPAPAGTSRTSAPLLTGPLALPAPDPPRTAPSELLGRVLHHPPPVAWPPAAPDRPWVSTKRASSLAASSGCGFELPASGAKATAARAIAAAGPRRRRRVKCLGLRQRAPAGRPAARSGLRRRRARWQWDRRADRRCKRRGSCAAAPGCRPRPASGQ